MKSQVQQWSSWRSREFVVREAGDTGPIALAVRGVFGAAIDISSLRRTETTVEGGGPSTTVWGAGRRRFIVPSEFNSVDVFRRSVGSSSASGFGPWKVTRLADEEIEIAAGHMSGRGPWVLRVGDSRTELRIIWNEGKHPGTLTLFGPGPGGDKEFRNDNRTRETISVTGPGYLLLDADHWTLDTC
ncbi:hypothetical protein ABZS76_16335 [Streptomyces sp. NPDC005562]|uniref:hypothetical protein n=1 Tax=Streptomyces sp. NPDC005562 TaxID=3154890 RepID=UPI0033B0EB40